MKIYALQFNNYFNRKIKKYSTVEDYISNSSHAAPLSNGEDVNFIPNDDVTTDLIIDWNEKWNPDYLIVINDDNTINSRWFIKEKVRQCAEQFNLTLKRDTVADKLEIVLNSPCFIEKGFVSPDNPLIFNKEDFNCNQIKKGELLLKDKSQCSWIVLYYDLKSKNELTGQVSTIEEPYVEIGSTLEDWDLYEYIENGYKYPISKTLGIKFCGGRAIGVAANGYLYYRNNVDAVFLERNVEEPVANAGTLQYKQDDWDGQHYFVEGGLTSANSRVNGDRTILNSRINDYGEPSTSLSAFLEWDNKIIKTSDNKFYKISITSNGEEYEDVTLSSGSLYDRLCDLFKPEGSWIQYWNGSFDNAFSMEVNYGKYTITATNFTNSVRTFDINFSSIRDTQDCPFGIICLPYKTLDRYGRPLAVDLDFVNENLSVLIARKLCEAGVGSSGPIYDVQLLPYCPLDLTGYPRTNMIDLLCSIDLKSADYMKIKDQNNVVGSVALFPVYSNFTKVIGSLKLDLIWKGMNFATAQGSNKHLVKVENQCTFYRIVSPNYNGQFEFNRAKLEDNIYYMSADCTYKPYQPYIHVSPIFTGLYGDDYDDARGLVCGGDFSFGAVTSAFETYKLQNKNYQDIFNREIENLDTNYEITQKYGQINAAIGAIGSGAAGIGGLLMGHPAAAAGGGIGILGSAGAGISNFYQNRERHSEQRDYALDIHNYRLDNVKALPNSLAKVDAFNYNNKIFPFLERYSCTDEEIEIFKEKLKYEGMTVNANGKLKDYLETGEETFVKGQLIRLEGLDEEDHFARDIYNEVASGLYIKEGE